MLNEVPALSVARQPRGLVKINGEVVPGWISWEVDNNTFYQADTFRCRFALSSMPPDKGAAWWASQKEIFVEVLSGFPVDPEWFDASELDSLIYGKVDDVTYDPVGRLIELRGRDLTSELIDAKTTEKFQNLTASQIAEQLAARHGLTPKVTATKTKVGTYYEIDHARLTDERSEWDLLTYLAHEEGFVVYLKGKALHFEPLPTESQNPYVLRWEPPVDDRGFPIFNGKSISFSRNLTVAKGVVVTVRSWNAKNNKSFTVTYPTHKARGTAPGKASPPAQNYAFTKPGKTPEQALQWAQAKHREITQHEMRLAASMPADNVLKVTDIIRVEGTDSPFDQTYYPESINRAMSLSDGYTMMIAAKNVSPENQVSLGTGAGGSGGHVH
jgi:phage protein D